MYKNRGLVYRILDAQGNKVGVPIRASSISGKPTLDNLEKKFISNETKEPLKQRTRNGIDEAFYSGVKSMNKLVSLLEQKNIYTVLRQNVDGRLYGITFVDNQNKCVFNGSDLGKVYSATALQARINEFDNGESLTESSESIYNSNRFPSKEFDLQKNQDKDFSLTSKNDSLLEILMAGNQQQEQGVSGLLKKKRKKRKKDKRNII